MSSELTEIAIPSIAFFVGFFLVFLLIELLVVFLLNGFVFNHWGFVVDVVMRAKVRHGTLIRILTLIFIFVFVALFVKFTAILNIIMSSTLEEKFYSAQVILVIFLTYMIATRQLAELNFLKQIHRYLYFYLSTLVFVLMILLVHSQYENYQTLINAKIVVPLENNVKLVLENQKRKELLNDARRMIHNNTCFRADFTTDLVNGHPVTFLYLTTDPDLALSNITVTGDISRNYTVGRACTTQNETFLLTDYGQWYWVIEQV